MAEWLTPQGLLDLNNHNIPEHVENIPSSLQQMFADIGGTAFTNNPQREISALNVNINEQQQSEQGMRGPIGDSLNTFHCIQCGKVYMSKGNLTRHLKFECGKEPQFQCPHCPIRTKHKSSLLTHIFCKHPGM